MTRLRVATWNIGDGPHLTKVAGLRELAQYADTIGLQEGSDRRGEIAEFLRREPEWDAFFGDGSPGASAVPLLHRTSLLRVVRSRTIPAVPPRWVGPKGAGPTRSKRKVINASRLRVRGFREPVHHLTTHWIPSVQRGGLSPQEERARRAHYRAHSEAARRAVLNRRGVVLLTGDMNAEQQYDGLDPLRQVNMRCATGGLPTHGKRAIDQVWVGDRTREGRVLFLDRMAVNLPSDHDGAVVVLELL